MSSSSAPAVFLFGAGASYGSDDGGTPPLGARLFAELQRLNRDGWGQLPQHLASMFERDFETGMATLASERPHDMGPLQRAMAAYFFQFQPRTTSLYVELARRLRNSTWNGAICSLNYERLLEISLAGAGIHPALGARSDLPTQVELCLPHGCCHIFSDSVQLASGMASFSGTQVFFDGQLVVVTDPAEFHRRILSNAVPPVMSYFEPRKLTTSGRSLIDGQRARWAEMAREARAIAIVGAQVRPHDNHIWDPLRDTAAELVYCSGPTAADSFAEWAAVHRAGKQDRILPGYFRPHFEEMCRLVRL